MQPAFASVDQMMVRTDDSRFVELLDSYRPSGGLLRGDDVAELMRRRGSGDHASLGRQIVAREILSFEWNHTIWIPAFQLEAPLLHVRRGVQAVLQELGTGFAGWQAADWFVSPNAWVEFRAPVNVLRDDLPALLNAARADRFTISG